MEKQPEAGVVLHQPLNRAIFRIFGKKGQKMNGISVSRSRKTQNAPTWQVENTAPERPFFDISRGVPGPHILYRFQVLVKQYSCRPSIQLY